MILVIAEHQAAHFKPATLSVISAARELNQPIHLLVIGYQCDVLAKKAQKIAGITQVLLADDRVYEPVLAERWADLIFTISKNNQYRYIFASATTFGKNIMPRVAALLDVSQISDITAILNENTYERPIYAGNIIQTVQSLDSIQVVTVRVSAFSVAEEGETVAPIVRIDYVSDNLLSQFVQLEKHDAGRPELVEAQIIISGGRGLQNKENFLRLTAIADRLGAGVGASRAAVDAGFAPNDFQVGQTGQIVAPNLYFAVGISGAIQHLAGMKESKIIVAINKDMEAPIFQYATYGLVADLQEVLIEWEKVLTEMGY